MTGWRAGGAYLVEQYYTEYKGRKERRASSHEFHAAVALVAVVIELDSAAAKAMMAGRAQQAGRQTGEEAVMGLNAFAMNPSGGTW